MVANLKDHPAKFPDRASQSRRAQILGCVTPPSRSPIAQQLRAQHLCRLTIGHASAIAARGLAQKSVTLIDRE
jgi:hypothetical protein